MGKRSRKNNPLFVNEKRKAVLFRKLKVMYLRRGFDPQGKSLVTMASTVMGRTVAHQEAYRWLDLQDRMGKLGKPLVLGREKVSLPANFYHTQEWQRVRYEALKRSSGSCCLCGRTHRQHGIVLHVDHIKPKIDFPELAFEVDNLQVMCEDCNVGKSNLDDTDWRSRAWEF